MLFRSPKGWGTTEFAGPVSNILQKVDVSVYSLLKCQSLLKSVTSNHICTTAKGKDACQVTHHITQYTPLDCNERLFNKNL